ncbi:MAG: DJ-1/PfpI family protein [Solirubrobacterales bacterium]
MQIAIPIFEGFTALDAIGPYEVLSRLPGAEVVLCGERRGPTRTESGMVEITADLELGEVESPDVIVVPGGVGNRRLLDPDGAYPRWIAAADEHTTWTTSVCTGSLMLAAAGLLDGVEATTHWAARESLAELGAIPIAQRVVERGKLITAAGVSAGIDMALTLVERIAGETVSQAIQLGIEYDPDPPHDTGSLEKAPPELVALVREMIGQEDARADELAAGGSVTDG